MYSQTSNDNGDMNENKFTGGASGWAYKMLMPVLIEKLIPFFKN